MEDYDEEVDALVTVLLDPSVSSISSSPAASVPFPIAGEVEEAERERDGKQNTHRLEDSGRLEEVDLLGGSLSARSVGEVSKDTAVRTDVQNQQLQQHQHQIDKLTRENKSLFATIHSLRRNLATAELEIKRAQLKQIEVETQWEKDFGEKEEQSARALLLEKDLADQERENSDLAFKVIALENTVKALEGELALYEVHSPVPSQSHLPPNNPSLPSVPAPPPHSQTTHSQEVILSARIRELEYQLNASIEATRSAESHARDMEDIVRIAKAENARIQSQLNDAQHNYATDSSASFLQERIVNLEAEKLTIQSELHNQTTRISQLEASLAASESRANSLDAHFSIERRQNVSNAKTASRASHFEQQSNNLQERVRELSAALEKSHHEHARVFQLYNNADSALQSLRIEFETEQRKRIRAEEDRDAAVLAAKLAVAKEEETFLKNQQDKGIAQIDFEKRQVQGEDRWKARLHQMETEFKSRIETFEAKIKQITNERMELEKGRNDLVAEKSVLEQRCAEKLSASDQLKQELVNEVSRLKEELANTQDDCIQFAELNESFEAQIGVLQQSISDALSQNRGLRSQLAEMEGKCGMLQADISQFEIVLRDCLSCLVHPGNEFLVQLNRDPALFRMNRVGYFSSVSGILDHVQHQKSPIQLILERNPWPGSNFQNVVTFESIRSCMENLESRIASRRVSPRNTSRRSSTHSSASSPRPSAGDPSTRQHEQDFHRVHAYAESLAAQLDRAHFQHSQDANRIAELDAKLDAALHALNNDHHHHHLLARVQDIEAQTVLRIRELESKKMRLAQEVQNLRELLQVAETDARVREREWVAASGALQESLVVAGLELNRDNTGDSGARAPLDQVFAQMLDALDTRARMLDATLVKREKREDELEGRVHALQGVEDKANYLETHVWSLVELVCGPDSVFQIDVALAQLRETFLYLQRCNSKLQSYRADLSFQKRYLSLRIDDLLESEQLLLRQLNSGNVDADCGELVLEASARRKWKRAFLVVVAALRFSMF